MGRKADKAMNSKAKTERRPFWVKDQAAPKVQLEEKAMAIFQPDVLIESQFQATQSRKLPLDSERVLMFAVLRDAVSCFQDHVMARANPKRQMHLEAEAWILARDRSYLFSFDNVCESLGYDPEYMRAGLRRWKEAILGTRERKLEANPLAG